MLLQSMSNILHLQRCFLIECKPSPGPAGCGCAAQCVSDQRWVKKKKKKKEAKTPHWRATFCICVTWVYPLPLHFRRPAAGLQSIASNGMNECEHLIVNEINIGRIFHRWHFSTQINQGEKINFVWDTREIWEHVSLLCVCAELSVLSHQKWSITPKRKIK